MPRNQRLSRGLWDEVIHDMRTRYEAKWITDAEAETIAAYLAKYRGHNPIPEPALPPQPAEPPADPKVRPLLEAGACLACHAVDRAHVGPAFRVIAARYRGEAGAAERLVKKIRSGGSGVWGGVPMPPNATLSDADLKTLVGWVLAR